MKGNCFIESKFHKRSDMNMKCIWQQIKMRYFFIIHIYQIWQVVMIC